MSRTIPNVVNHRYDGVTEIAITRRLGMQYTMLLDTLHFPGVDGLQIHVNPTRHGRSDFYAKTRIFGKQILLHRLFADFILAGAPTDKLEVDHINGNTLDCRMSNLRPANRVDQMRNTRRNREATTND